MARALIVGSGFSASFGLPTLAGLFDEIMNQPVRAGETDVTDVHQAVPWFYPGFRVFGGGWTYPPLEQFLSLVDAARELPSFEPGYWDRVRRSALRLLTDYFKDQLPEAARHGLLAKVAERLRPGDVVVTFNWDNLVERALENIRSPFSLTGRKPGSVLLLKLHGSINWVRPPEPWQPAVPGSVVELGDGVFRTADFSPYDVWDALDAPPLIVPPSASKAPLADPFLNPLWHEAALAIREIERLSVIGYSMPDDDLQARALLCTSFRARTRPYALVDPNAEIAEKYRAWLGAPARFFCGPFSGDVLDQLLES